MYMHMNTPELSCYLKGMAKMSKTYDETICKGIITAIINHYLVFPTYMEEDAIKTFEDFLNTGILLW